MNPLSAALVLVGAGLALVASLGLVRLRTPYARFHAAGKASPVAFLAVAVGMGIELGGGVAARLLLAAAALTVTLPIGVHLLFRATHRTGAGGEVVPDELGHPAPGRPEAP